MQNYGPHEALKRYRTNHKEEELLLQALEAFNQKISIDFKALEHKLKLNASDAQHWNEEIIKKWLYNASRRKRDDEKTDSKELENVYRIAPTSLVFNKSLFRRKNIKKGVDGYHVYYSCTKCDCNIAFLVENNMLKPIEKFKHTLCITQEEREFISNQYLRIDLFSKAEQKVINGEVTGPHSLLRSVLLDESIKASEEDKLKGININDCKRIINDNKEKTKKIADVTIPEKAAVIQRGALKIDFLKLHLLSPCRIVIFSCNKQCSMLSNSSNLFIDGTFKERPADFKDSNGQLLNFLIWDSPTNVYIPVVHVLMTGRSEMHYGVLFNLINAFFDVKNIKDIFVDFEKSLSNALLQWKPDINIHKCFFHYTQCLWRRMKSIYSNPEIGVGKLLLKILKQLPFHDYTLRCIVIIKIREMNHLEINQMLEYYVCNWINEYFALDYCPDEPLTNNGCESFHSQLSAMMCAKTPSIELLSNTLFTLFEDRVAKRATAQMPTSPDRPVKNFKPIKIDELMRLVDCLPDKIKKRGVLNCKQQISETKKLIGLNLPIDYVI